MIGTSKSFLLNKTIKGRVRYSDSFVGRGADDADVTNSQADTIEYDVTRDFMTNAYETNDWIRAIVDRVSERVSQLEFFPRPLVTNIDSEGKVSDTVKRKMEKVMNLMLKPNSDNESFNDLVGKVVKDVLVYDEAGIQIVKGQSYGPNNLDIGLFTNVSGEELFVNPEKYGTLPDRNTYLQIRNRKVVSKFHKYEFMNFIKNRRCGYANGFSPISTIALSVMGDYEMVNYNYKFFQNNARPNIAFIFEQLGFGKGQGALEKAKAWYKREHQGKPHLPLFMGAEKGNVKMLELKTTHKDMEFSNWQLLLLSRIMAVYGMQPMVLGVLTDTTGKLNSEVQTEQFKRNTLIPITSMLLHTLNATLIWGDSNLNFDDVYVTSTKLDIEDEEKQAKIDEMYLDRGVITINQVRNRLQMPAVDWGDEPFVPLNYAPLSLLEEFQRAKVEGTGAVDNNVKQGDDDDKDDKKPPKAKKFVTFDPQVEYVMKNFKVKTGLEKMEPNALKAVVDKMLRERESRLEKIRAFSTSNSLIGTIGRYGLKCKEIVADNQ